MSWTVRVNLIVDAASLINEEPMIESTASDEIDSALRSKKEAGVLAGQHLIPSPLRRHHLKFGVLGKRYSYGYLGKRNNGKNASLSSVQLPRTEAPLLLRSRRFGQWRIRRIGEWAARETCRPSTIRNVGLEVLFTISVVQAYQINNIPFNIQIEFFSSSWRNTSTPKNSVIVMYRFCLINKKKVIEIGTHTDSAAFRFYFYSGHSSLNRNERSRREERRLTWPSSAGCWVLFPWKSPNDTPRDAHLWISFSIGWECTQWIGWHDKLSRSRSKTKLLMQIITVKSHSHSDLVGSVAQTKEHDSVQSFIATVQTRREFFSQRWNATLKSDLRTQKGLLSQQEVDSVLNKSSERKKEHRLDLTERQYSLLYHESIQNRIELFHLIQALW